MDTDMRWDDRALAALSEQLSAAGAHFELVIVGGSALVALGLIERATRDVDVLGILSEAGLSSSEPFPEALAMAIARVARDLGLPADWLNSGPSALLDLGLPKGFLDRAHRVVDHTGGRHEEDLRALAPTPQELLAAARWTTSHDPSVGFRQQLLLALGRLGVDDATLE